jgi:hypothetical protein
MSIKEITLNKWLNDEYIPKSVYTNKNTQAIEKRKHYHNINHISLKELSNAKRQRGIFRSKRDYYKTLIHIEENDYEIHYTGPLRDEYRHIEAGASSEGPTEQELVDKYSYVISDLPDSDTHVRYHTCCLDNTEYTIGADCPCSKYFKNTPNCKLCDYSTGNVCPFHFNIRKLSIEQLADLMISEQLLPQTLIELFGIKRMSRYHFNIYITYMTQKFLHSNNYDSDYEYEYDQLIYDDYMDDEYTHYFGDYSELRRRRKSRDESNRRILKKIEEKKQKRDNTKKAITSIISLEILKKKLNNDCLAKIASFLSGKDDSMLNQLKSLKKTLS